MAVLTRIEFEVLSGVRAGQKGASDKALIELGRHPQSDVRFDAEGDLDTSTKHAAILQGPGGVVLRDLASRNGTFLNGHRVTQDTPLSDGDVIRCGAKGPEVRVRFAGAATTAPAGAPSAAAKPAPPTHAAPAGPSATSVLRAQVQATTARSRSIAITLGIVIVGAAAVLVWQGLTARSRQQRLASVVDTLRTQLDSLRALKAAADSEAARLQREMTSARGDPARLASLQVRFSNVQRRQRGIEAAQGVDYAAIQRANTAAIAVIVVRFSDTTQVFEGTAFCVSPTGVMLTNRHTVLNREGEQARDVAIRFSGSTEVLPARIVRVAPDADLAVIQVESGGPFPAVAGMLTATPEAGAPIALIGFPGGCGSCERPSAKLVTGSITNASDSLLEMDAFSGTGASGSPIFDRNGQVVGVLFGGRGGESSTEIVGLPIRRAQALLR